MTVTEEMIVLGDEAVALGAIHAGMSAAYGYPGTPSTEIMEYLIACCETLRSDAGHEPGLPIAQWCSNEKTALEEALGASFAGRRALATMKHVGLNVAADPFMNGALLNINGGLVIAVCDDPQMHSSQNEQDSRFFADFARIPCLEPVDQQEAYDMTREAFELSERLHKPVLLRLVTRLSHSRSSIAVRESRAQNPMAKAQDKENWILLPARARIRWAKVIAEQPVMEDESRRSPWNQLDLAGRGPTNRAPFGVLCTGLGYNYFRENRSDLPVPVPFLRVGQYPLPKDAVRTLAQVCESLVVLEEGYPFAETLLKGILPQRMEIRGKLDAAVPPTGELNPGNVRPALGLPPVRGFAFSEDSDGFAARVRDGHLPPRPPQLCSGCPHGDSYRALKEALTSFEDTVVCADIGCYALGVLPPHGVPETIVCMGASITMAKGASEAGYRHAVGVIGDSTFFHSGITGLVDAVAAGTSVTILVLDNSTTAMTGGQPTILEGHKIAKIAEAVGVEPPHIRVFEARPNTYDESVRILREEIAFPGVSVVIAVRECLETIRKRKTGAAS